jgi:hypothetical protein
MELDTKFKEAIEAGKAAAALDLDIAKMAQKIELKKGDGDNIPQHAVGAGKASPA